jgi:glycosidase
MDAVRLAMLLQMTLPGAPCVYYGDELGMEGLMDPDCRRAFPSDPVAWEREPGAWLADLLALRHSSRALRDGELALLRADGLALAYLRHHADDAYACILNAADVPLAWDLDLPVGCSSADLVLLRGERLSGHARLVGDRQLRVELPARHGSIVRLRSALRSSQRAEPILGA